MSPVACTDSDKEWFDEFQNEDETQADAFSRMVDQVKAYNGELVDPEEQAELTAEKMGPKLELALYRVVEEMGEGLGKHGTESQTGP